MDTKTTQNKANNPAFGGGWLFGLKPEDTVVPRYEADVIDTNQPRAAKAYRRQLRRSLEQQWHHFWLPHRNLSDADGDNSSLSSDSEDDTLLRERLICRKPEETSPVLEESGDATAQSLILQHQTLEKTIPDISPHTCSYCRKVAVDLRRQHAYQILPADKQRPKGWRVQPSRTGFTHEEAVAAADDGCSFFSFVVRSLHIQGPTTATDYSFDVTMTGTVQSVASMGLSIQRRYGERTVHRHNPVQSLNLYTIPGMVEPRPTRHRRRIVANPQ
jgi:hypothetical protein